MDEPEFSSPEEMQQAYDQMWEDIADSVGYVPYYFESAVSYACTNPVGILVTSFFLVLIAFTFIRWACCGFGRR